MILLATAAPLGFIVVLMPAREAAGTRTTWCSSPARPPALLRDDGGLHQAHNRRPVNHGVAATATDWVGYALAVVHADSASSSSRLRSRTARCPGAWRPRSRSTRSPATPSACSRSRSPCPPTAAGSRRSSSQVCWCVGGAVALAHSPSADLVEAPAPPSDAAEPASPTAIGHRCAMTWGVTRHAPDEARGAAALWRQLALGLALFGFYLVVDSLQRRGARRRRTLATGGPCSTSSSGCTSTSSAWLNHWLAPHHVLATLANYEYATTYILSALALLALGLGPPTRPVAAGARLVHDAEPARDHLLRPLSRPRRRGCSPRLGSSTPSAGAAPSAPGERARRAAPTSWRRCRRCTWAGRCGSASCSPGSPRAAGCSWLSAVHVPLTVYVVMATANHYLLDAVAVVVPIAVGGQRRRLAGRAPAARGGRPARDAFFLHVEDTGCRPARRRGGAPRGVRRRPARAGGPRAGRGPSWPTCPLPAAARGARPVAAGPLGERRRRRPGLARHRAPASRRPGRSAAGGRRAGRATAAPGPAAVADRDGARHRAAGVAAARARAARPPRRRRRHRHGAALAAALPAAGPRLPVPAQRRPRAAGPRAAAVVVGSGSAGHRRGASPLPAESPRRDFAP